MKKALLLFCLTLNVDAATLVVGNFSVNHSSRIVTGTLHLGDATGPQCAAFTITYGASTGTNPALPRLEGINSIRFGSGGLGTDGSLTTSVGISSIDASVTSYSWSFTGGNAGVFGTSAVGNEMSLTTDSAAVFNTDDAAFTFEDSAMNAVLDGDSVAAGTTVISDGERTGNVTPDVWSYTYTNDSSADLTYATTSGLEAAGETYFVTFGDFSGHVIPEPSSFALLSFSLLGLIFHRRR